MTLCVERGEATVSTCLASNSARNQREHLPKQTYILEGHALAAVVLGLLLIRHDVRKGFGWILSGFLDALGFDGDEDLIL